MTALEMDDNTYNQFIMLEDWLIEYVNSGGMDLSGWSLQDDSSPFMVENEIVCEEGTVGEYSTFSCSESVIFMGNKNDLR